MSASSTDDNPQLGATFTPGGDDYYGVPVVLGDALSPITPGFPPQLQHGPSQIREQMAVLDITSPLPPQHNGIQIEAGSNGTPTSSQLLPPPRTQSNTFPPRTSSQTLPPVPRHDSVVSIFPLLLDRRANVPPSSEEQEVILETARLPVLNSTDVEMQLTWAYDTLQYVEIAEENEHRASRTFLKRPTTPATLRQLRVDAMNIVSFLADQQHPRADYIRGMWHEFGKLGYAQNKAEAFRCYKRSASKGYARAEYRMGMQFESTNEFSKALQHYRQGESMGDAASCYRMGMIALLGQLGQAQDYARGIQLIQHAADVADENAPQGAYVFGMLLSQELPKVKIPENVLQPDPDAGRMYIEKSAFLGFSKGQLKMGSAYELCSLGCDFDPTLSLHYNVLAARQGETEAELAVSKWFLCGYDGVFQRSDQAAYEYAQRAANGGLAMAEFAMGYFHEIGVHASVDLDIARGWYSKAAKKGNKDAMARIAEISLKRTLSKKEHEDVAVTRIRSQHGSRRGGRPERFSRASTIMPSIPDDSSVQMANAQIFTKPGYARMVAGAPITSQQPERLVSVAPYPVDYDHPVSALQSTLNDLAPEAVEEPERRSSPSRQHGRSNSPAIHQPVTASSPAPRSSTATPPPVLAAHAPYILPPTSVPPRSLSPTRKPVPSRSQTPQPQLQQTRQASPGPPRLELGFTAPTNSFLSESSSLFGNNEPIKVYASNNLIQSSLPALEPSSHVDLPPVISSINSSRTATPPLGSRSQKGPSTFEEMGVPMAKQEQDCVIM